MEILERAKISSFSREESIHRVALIRAVFEHAGGRSDPTRRQFILTKSVYENLKIFGDIFDVCVDVHAQDFCGFDHPGVIHALSQEKPCGYEIGDISALTKNFPYTSIAFQREKYEKLPPALINHLPYLAMTSLDLDKYVFPPCSEDRS